jgi:hypothetical protein
MHPNLKPHASIASVHDDVLVNGIPTNGTRPKAHGPKAREFHAK